jgi:hypothetical protein
MGAAFECQCSQGKRSSFITKVPLRWLSKGPLPCVGPWTAWRELPAKTQDELAPTVW